MRFLAIFALLLAGCGATPTALPRATSALTAAGTCRPEQHKCDDPAPVPVATPTPAACQPVGYVVRDPRTGRCVWVGRR